MTTHVIDRAVARATGIDGWLTVDQARRLAAAAAECRPGGQIVEIGSFRGRSTVVLASAAPDGVLVVAIDPHAGNDRGPQEIAGYTAEAAADRATFERNLNTAGVRHRVRHVASLSDAAHAAVEGSVDVLFIDGAHRYAPARDDLRTWGGRVGAGGVLFVHDAFSSIGVTLAIGRVLLGGRRFRYVGRTRSLAEYRADLSPRPLDRAGNVARQLASLPWFVRNVAVKAWLSAGGGRLFARLGRSVPDWPY
ncbi:class I SAM-dependent methyltransferase [soil metagenome]